MYRISIALLVRQRLDDCISMFMVIKLAFINADVTMPGMDVCYKG